MPSQLCRRGFTFRRGCRSAVQALALASLAQVGLQPPLAWAEEDRAAVARLGWAEGEVSTLRRGDTEWATGEVNEALVAGDRLAVGPGSRAELETAPRLYLWLGGETDLDLIGLGQTAAQLRLNQGTLMIARRNGSAGSAAEALPPVEVLIPAGTVALSPQAVARIDVAVGGATSVRARAGRLVVQAGGQQVSLEAPGSWAIEGQGSLARVVAVAEPPEDEMDVWTATRRARFDAVASATYVNSEIEGLADLDEAGVWQENSDYGWIWRPSVVTVGWAPYAVGRWGWVEPWGWTWVDAARWGWAPFHYGRWVRNSGSWWWAPGPLVAATPVWAPALVGFTWASPGISVSIGAGVPWVGWVPLGWGEPCLPWWSTGGVSIGNPWWGGWYGPQVINNIIIAPGYDRHGRPPRGHHGQGGHGGRDGSGGSDEGTRPGRGPLGPDEGGSPRPGGGGGPTAGRRPLGNGADANPDPAHTDGRLPQRVRWAHQDSGAVGGAPANQLDRGGFQRAVLGSRGSPGPGERLPINPRSNARVEQRRFSARDVGASPSGDSSRSGRSGSPVGAGQPAPSWTRTSPAQNRQAIGASTGRDSGSPGRVPARAPVVESRSGADGSTGATVSGRGRGSEVRASSSGRSAPAPSSVSGRRALAPSSSSGRSAPAPSWASGRNDSAPSSVSGRSAWAPSSASGRSALRTSPWSSRSNLPTRDSAAVRGRTEMPRTQSGWSSRRTQREPVVTQTQPSSPQRSWLSSRESTPRNESGGSRGFATRAAQPQPVAPTQERRGWAAERSSPPSTGNQGSFIRQRSPEAPPAQNHGAAPVGGSRSSLGGGGMDRSGFGQPSGGSLNSGRSGGFGGNQGGNAGSATSGAGSERTGLGRR